MNDDGRRDRRDRARARPPGARHGRRAGRRGAYLAMFRADPGRCAGRRGPAGRPYAGWAPDRRWPWCSPSRPQVSRRRTRPTCPTRSSGPSTPCWRRWASPMPRPTRRDPCRPTAPRDRSRTPRSRHRTLRRRRPSDRRQSPPPRRRHRGDAIARSAEPSRPTTPTRPTPGAVVTPPDVPSQAPSPPPASNTPAPTAAAPVRRLP